MEEQWDKSGFSYRDHLGQDRWESFTPSRTGWTDVGTPTVTGLYRSVGKQCFFMVEVVPGTTVSTSVTSYVNLPITATGLSGMATMINSTSSVSVGVCAISVSSSRVYTPGQGTTANTLVLAGWYQI